MSGLSWETLIMLGQIAFIDLVLAGDNAIVVGLAVSGLPAQYRRKAILIGMGGAVVLRILFSLIALSLLEIIGLTLAGGILLVWVAWKLYRELRAGAHSNDAADGAANENAPVKRTLSGAVGAILLADVSMSLDNALAVAGAAEGHPALLIIGLALSVALMAVAAEWVARLIVKYRWLAYVGLAVVAYVAVEMIVRGSREVLDAL
jgi:YjbE family integral membrane protein